MASLKVVLEGGADGQVADTVVASNHHLEVKIASVLGGVNAIYTVVEGMASKIHGPANEDVAQFPLQTEADLLALIERTRDPDQDNAFVIIIDLLFYCK